MLKVQEGHEWKDIPARAAPALGSSLCLSLRRSLSVNYGELG